MSSTKRTKRILAAILALSVFAACASKKDVDTAEAAFPIDESAADTAPLSEADIFADLATGSSVSNIESGSASESVGGSTNASDQGLPFYSAVGGESLGRVAYALYGSPAQSGVLRKMNPGLHGGQALQAGQSVYFETQSLSPRPMFLTKDLIQRYPDELAKALSGETVSTATLPGETLQAVSQRLYGTTRYWTEIYLLNRDKLKDFDKVPKGAALVVISRPGGFDAYAQLRAEFGGVVSIKQAKTPTQASTSYVVQASSPQPVPTAAPPVAAVAPPKAVDEPFSAGVVDTQVSPPPPKTIKPQPVSAGVGDTAEEGMFSSTNFRRMIYVALILVITVFAFYMTRPSKKQKFDMLDMTANSTSSRPKLKDKDRDAI